MLFSPVFSSACNLREGSIFSLAANVTMSVGGEIETPGDVESRFRLFSSRWSTELNGASGIIGPSLLRGGVVRLSGKKESLRKRPRALSSDVLGVSRPEPGRLISRDPERPSPELFMRLAKLGDFLEKKDMIPEGKSELFDLLLVAEGCAGLRTGRLGCCSALDGVGRDLDNFKETFESDKKCCSRRRDKCT